MIDSVIEPGECQGRERRDVQEQKEEKIRDYESLWNEINESLASNSFINTEEHIEKINVREPEEDLDIWETPRASWHTTCDGYIQACQLDKTAGLTDLYGKITRSQNYDKILTSEKRDKDSDAITYSSHVTLSYTNANKVTTSTILARLIGKGNGLKLVVQKKLCQY